MSLADVTLTPKLKEKLAAAKEAKDEGWIDADECKEWKDAAIADNIATCEGRSSWLACAAKPTPPRPAPCSRGAAWTNNNFVHGPVNVVL
jgi:hypothetical protein